MSVLETPVELFQNEAEFVALLELYRDRAPRRVLELGTFHGGTLYHWIRNAPAGALVVSVDRYDLADNRGRYTDWLPTGVEVVAIAGDTASPETQAAVAALGPYEWIFIDADHRLQNVRADWLAYRELVAPGGVVVFHDILPSHDRSIQVDRLWAELRESHETVEFCEPGGFGLGVVLNPQVLA